MKLRTLLAALGLALLLASSAFAQVEPDPSTGLKQITSTSAALDVVLGPLTSRGTATVQTYGTWTGTFPIQGSLSRDCTTGGTYFTIPGTSSITTNGGVQVTIAGIRCIKIPASGWTSGTANVIIQASGTGGGTGGTGTIGDITSNAEFVATEDTLSVASGYLLYIRDHLSTDPQHGGTISATGPQPMCESKDIDGGALPNLVTEGQPARQACVLNGALLNVLTNEGGTLDIGALMQTSLALLDDIIFTDEGAFTYTTSKVGVLGAVAESTTDAIADGLAGALTMDTARRLIVTNTPTTYGGLTKYRSLDLDEGSGEVAKSGAGQLYAMWVTNRATSTRWIKVYDNTSCTMGTGTPDLTIGIPGNSSDNVAGQLTTGGYGWAFATGFCFGATTGFADNDTGAPGTNDVVVDVFIK